MLVHAGLANSLQSTLDERSFVSSLLVKKVSNGCGIALATFHYGAPPTVLASRAVKLAPLSADVN